MRFKAFSAAVFFLLIILSISFQQIWRICIKVVDGDTIILNGGEKVRLIGINTPETKDLRKPVQYFGKEAFEFTKSLVEGKKVRLEYDLNIKDKYGNTLAYIYLEDGTFLNAEIIKQGYGSVYTKFPFKYFEEFRMYEREARKNKVGIWAVRNEKKPGILEDNTVYITRTGKKYHRGNCIYFKKKAAMHLKDKDGTPDIEGKENSYAQVISKTMMVINSF